ncbi:hypothetical protein BDP27DRAFT_1445098 [Rhodocollybia butyracea]|uniref:Uncharacterized protein n=1 Tax=Rhodocollybia butyracea TaxID=206335 RepID=A0A9P5Q1X9_9AGAR|nr:hypothetical protein BDP27DRAFT_1445098 [Rhodocollybia butyracea]
MLRKHHWLCFILLAVLISPAWAVPTPTPEPSKTKYSVTVREENNAKVEKIPPKAKRINEFIIDMGEAMGDGNEPHNVKHWSLEDINMRFEISEMLYYELQGGKFCSKICYGYIVTTDLGWRGLVKTAAVIAQDPTHPCRFSVLHLPLPTRFLNDQFVIDHQKDRYLEFLTVFAPIKDWMPNVHDPVFHDVVREAMLILADPAAAKAAKEAARASKEAAQAVKRARAADEAALKDPRYKVAAQVAQAEANTKAEDAAQAKVTLKAACVAAKVTKAENDAKIKAKMDFKYLTKPSVPSPGPPASRTPPEKFPNGPFK